MHAQDSIHVQGEVRLEPIVLSQVNPENMALTGFCGKALDAPLELLLSDPSGHPVPGIQVVYTLIAYPENGEDAMLQPQLVVSDSSGVASSTLILGSIPGTYRVSARIEEGFPDNELIFTARASKRNWVWILMISLLGGLGLFLFGMHTMSEGMQQSAGARLRTILENVTRNRIVGAGIGTFVTTIIQSSSATSVMLVSFVNAGLLKFRQTIPVLLGAAIGTTITAQIIAFKITEYSLLLVAAGFFLQTFSKKERFKSVGYALFGFGILFFGLEIMSDAMAPLRDYAPFIDLLLRLESPLLGILVGAAFTALIQSSSAFIGIMIVLASQGLLSLDACIPLLLGSNLGTPVTALLASMKSGKEAARIAKKLFTASVVDGKIDVQTVRTILGKLIDEKPRGFMALINSYWRLVRLEAEKNTALVESAEALESGVKSQLEADLKKKYGDQVEVGFARNPELLGGMKIRVGSDVWDGSVKSRIDSLSEKFS
jgi:Na/Pi-cotransporter